MTHSVTSLAACRPIHSLAHELAALPEATSHLLSSEPVCGERNGLSILLLYTTENYSHLRKTTDDLHTHTHTHMHTYITIHIYGKPKKTINQEKVLQKQG